MPLDKNGVMKPGLKLLRRATAIKPTIWCGNCECFRYSPCGCKSNKNSRNRVQGRKKAKDA